MRYLKEYNEYFGFEIEDICDKCDKLGIKNWSVNKDGLIDVEGDVDLGFKRLNKLPLKFGKVGGNFFCHYNELTTLEGSPSEVGGHFSCDNNQLISLEGGPIEVGGYFNCGSNQLTTLEYFPRVVGKIYIGSSRNPNNNPLPKEIYDNEKYLKKIIEYGPEYDIWRDGKLYLPRFRDLMIDIREGL